MAVSSRAESEEADEAVSGAWTAYFLAAAAYRTTAAATGNGGARSFDQSGFRRVHLGQFCLHSRTEIGLRVRRVDVLPPLPRGNRGFRGVEGLAQRVSGGQRVAVERLAEVGQIAVVRTAERGAIGGRCGNDDGLRVPQ